MAPLIALPCRRRTTWTLLFLILLLLRNSMGSNGGDAPDDMLHRGDTNVIRGVIMGDTEAMRLGVSEGGEPNAVLTELIGYVLGLGRVHVDFPVLPAPHLTMTFGTQAHSNVIFDLLNKGADVNMFRLLEGPSDYGYAPAMLYALGLGPTPTAQHVAVLQRTYVSLPDKFNFSAVEEWIAETRNPPLSHISTLVGCTECLYVLYADLKWKIDEQDAHGLSPLHVAAWLGDIMTVALLLTNNANRLLPDKYGRLPLHYAAMRGHIEVIDLLFIQPTEGPDVKPKNWARTRRSMLTHLDKDKRSALMLAALVPSIPISVRGVRQQMTKDKLLPGGRWNRAPLRGQRKVISSSEFDDPLGATGGWASLTPAQQEDAVKSEKADIDVINTKSLSRGVFKRDYFYTQRPLLISGEPTAGQPIWLYWTRKELVERYGELDVRVGEALYAEKERPIFAMPRVRTMPLRAWVEEQMPPPQGAGAEEARVCMSAEGVDSGETCSAGKERSKWLASSLVPSSDEFQAKLRFDVQKPELFSLCGERDNEHLRVLVGPRGAGEPMQAREPSWTLLLAGKVRWLLVPPGVNATESLNLSGESDNDGNNVLVDYRLLSAVEWEAQVAPSIRARGLLSEVTQYPGEVLFVPPGWHASSILEADSLLIQQEFCTLLNTDQRVQPLGLALYGGNDAHRGLGRPKRQYRLSPKPYEKKVRIPTF